MSDRYTVEKHPKAPTVVTVRMKSGVDWEQWFLLRSDAHHDSPYSDHAMEKRHLEEAKDRGAGILDFGDLYDAMQGRFDKRQDPDQLRPELRVGQKQYLDALVAYNAAFYEPYAENFVLLSPGNHEASVLDRSQSNLTERLAERLRAKGSPVVTGTYQGWVVFRFLSRKSHRQSVRLRYTHGYGGGGPVTRGVIQTNREMVYVGNADILVSGHIHEKWHVMIPRETLSGSDRPVIQEVDYVRCAGYKDEYTPGQGWAVQKGLGPKPKGAWWLRFFYASDGSDSAVKYELTGAR